MKRVLIISDTCTHPTRMGNSFAILAQAKGLRSLGCDVHYLYYQVRQRGVNVDNYERSIADMREFWGENLHYFVLSSFERMRRNAINRIRDRFSNGRHALYDLYPHQLTNKTKELNDKYHFDVCIVNYIFHTKVFDFVDFPIKACFTHDTFAYKNLLVGERCLWVDANSEATALQKCTDVLAIQDEEMNYFKVLAPKSRHYSVFTPFEYHSQPICGNHNIVFLSGANIYNQNGLNWFLSQIFPLVKERFPDAQLVIGGGICNVIKEKFKSIKGVELVGFVNDPIEFYKLGDIAINPTYQGTGLKIKTFEAIANDKVTIVHPHSMSGIFEKDKAPLFSSSEPNEWVSFCESIWKDMDRIKNVKENNMNYIYKLNLHIEKEYTRLVNNDSSVFFHQ